MSNTEYRVESDLLGELQVPKEAYYGVQTQRAINNYKISNTKKNSKGIGYPENQNWYQKRTSISNN